MARRKKLDNLKEAFQKGFKEQFIQGLAQGSKAVAAVILEKAKDSSKSAEEKIDDIIAFCGRSLGQKEENK